MAKVLAENLADAEERVFDATHKPVGSKLGFVANMGEVVVADVSRLLARLGIVATPHEVEVQSVESDYSVAA